MAERKKWEKMIEVGGFRIRLYERPGGRTVYFSFTLDGTKVQKSTRSL